MTVTIQQQKSTPKKVAKKKPSLGQSIAPQMLCGSLDQSWSAPLTQDQELAVNEFASLRRELEETLEKQRSAEFIRKNLVEWAKQAPPKQRVVFQTEKSVVAFKACQDTRQVKDMKGLFNALLTAIGEEATFQLLKINLTDADKYLGKANVAKYVEEVDGARVLESYSLVDE
jgi:hypothetical protein